MGFLRNIVSMAAPFIGAAVGGPVGAGIGKFIGGAIAKPSAGPQQLMAPPPAPAGTGGMVKTAGTIPAIARGVAGGIGAGWRALAATMARDGSFGLIRNAAGAVVGWVSKVGKIYSRRDVARVAKHIGFDAAAVALGMTAVQLASTLADEQLSKRPARRRGISYGELRVTRRTLNKFQSMARLTGMSCRVTKSARRC